jgi:hypothetical protein
MVKRDPYPEQHSTARGNCLTVEANLATGKSHVLDAAEAARAAAGAAARNASGNNGVQMFSSNRDNLPS